MGIDVVIEHDAWQVAGLAPLATRAAAATLRHLNLDPDLFDIALLGCDDSRIASLNADFRDKPRPTNVLSWPSAERGGDAPGDRPAPPEPGEIGDIALAFETCRREADAAGRPLADHATHLIVHGILHLLGYDHETEPDAALMEGLETEILVSMGLPDPY